MDDDYDDEIMDNVQENLYKVLVIGEYGVGKVRSRAVRMFFPCAPMFVNFGPRLYFCANCSFYSFILWCSFGKTSIIRRYTEGYFSPNYKLTIGVDFAQKVIDWDETTRINLQLWDVAGHERFGHMTRVYYKYAIAAVIVFDLSRPATFEAVSKWYSDISQKVMLTNEKPIPIILLANKCDLEEFPVDRDKLDLYCQENGFSGWFPTSAKEDKNIEQAMQFLVQTILSVSERPSRPNTENTILLNGSVSPSLSYTSQATRGSTMDVYFPPSTDESYKQEYYPKQKPKCC